MDQMTQYVRQHFVDRATFVRRTGLAEQEVDALLNAKAAPGVVYSLSPDGSWWSALAGYVGSSSPSAAAGGQDWYAPAALWWVRRATLTRRAGQTHEDVSDANADTFIHQFLKALSMEPQASLNYPQCFDGEMPDVEAARRTGRDEWKAWVSGAYAVCLSHFSGETCVRKEVIACWIRKHFEGVDPDLVLDPIELFTLAEQLASILMPFAPFERDSGTPGRAVDRTLSTLGLGGEEPYVEI